MPNDKLTCTSTIEHAIPTPAINPHRAIHLRSYRLPSIHEEEVKRQTEKMLKDGIIQHSTNPWNFPILVVPKNLDSSGKTKWKVVIDFRKLDDVTVEPLSPFLILLMYWTQWENRNTFDYRLR